MQFKVDSFLFIKLTFMMTSPDDRYDHYVLNRLLSSKNFRKNYFLTKKKLKSLQTKLCQKWFLEKCLSIHVIPSTFLTHNKSCKNLSEKSKRQWKKETNRHARELIQLAINELEVNIDSVKRELEDLKSTIFSQNDFANKYGIYGLILEYERKVFRIAIEKKKKKLKNLAKKTFNQNQNFPPNTTSSLPPQAHQRNSPLPSHSPPNTPPPPPKQHPKNRPPPLPPPLPPPPYTLSQETNPPSPSPSISHTPPQQPRVLPSDPPPLLSPPLSPPNSSSGPLPKRKRKKNRPGINRRKFLKKLRNRQKKAKVNPVFNFSSCPLDSADNKLLNKGLNFAITTPAPTISEIRSDSKTFARRMEWKEYFFSEEIQPVINKSPQIFKSDKTNLPPGNPPKNLRAFLNTIETNLCDKSKWQRKLLNPNIKNISKEESKALEKLIKLQKDCLITIKPADKGSGICILDYNDYVKSCENHLKSTLLQPNDNPPLPYYTTATNHDINEAKKEILSTLQEAKQLGWITNQEFKAMDPSNAGIGKFYQIFKVHKEYEEGSIPPARPIVNGIGSITENISKFVDHHTRPLVQELPTFLEDTRHFLNMIEDVNEYGLPNDAILVTIDIKALYTNIRKEDALKSLHKLLEQRLDKTVPSIFLKKLTELILSHNFFEFKSKNYRQKIGTAMGTPAAPNIANITVGDLIDPKFVEIAERLYNGPEDPILRLRRFLDDFFMIWLGDIESLENFLEEINSIHPTIKFTSSYTCPFVCNTPPEVKHDCFCHTSRSISFLDTLVTIKNEKIITDLYRKPTDRCQYLLPSSSHPPHVIKNIPYSLCHRIVRICSEKPTLTKRLDELKDFLLSRNYDKKLIDSSIAKALNLERSEALKKVERKETIRPVFVTTYHPALPPVAKVLKDAWKVMILQDNHLKTVFPEPPLVAYKQPKNSSLRQLLVKSKLPERKQRILPGLKKCRKERCPTCPFIMESKEVYSTNNRNISTTLFSRVTCETDNLVYCITCNKQSCKFVQYIGETKRRLKDRFQEHLNCVKKLDKSTPTGNHFSSPGHSEHNMILQVLEKCKNRTSQFRKTRETALINLFDTRRHGLNLRG